MLKNESGYFSLIAILVVVVVFLVLFVYFWNTNWFGGGIKMPSISSQSDANTTQGQANQGDIGGQLNTLRKDVKNLQDKKDQEVMDELSK